MLFVPQSFDGLKEPHENDADFVDRIIAESADYRLIAEALLVAGKAGESPLQTVRRIIAESARLRVQVRQLNADLEAFEAKSADDLVASSESMRRIDGLEAEIKRLTAERDAAGNLLEEQRDILDEQAARLLKLDALERHSRALDEHDTRIKGWLAADKGP